MDGLTIVLGGTMLRATWSGLLRPWYWRVKSVGRVDFARSEWLGYRVGPVTLLRKIGPESPWPHYDPQRDVFVHQVAIPLSPGNVEAIEKFAATLR